MNEFTQPDKEMYVRQLIGNFITARAASGPNSAEWKRSLRAFYLFTGDYTRARDLSSELIKTSQPPYAIRDSVLLGLSERILGNKKPFDDAIANCPGTPREDLDRDPTDLRNGDYCRNVLNFDIMRAISIADEKPLPHAFSEVLEENATKASYVAVREFAAEQLTRIDPKAAKSQWRELLDSNVADWVNQRALWHLAKIAEEEKQWSEGIQWIDRYIDAAN